METTKTDLQNQIEIAKADVAGKLVTFQKLKQDFEKLKPGINSAKMEWENSVSNLEMLNRQQKALNDEK